MNPLDAIKQKLMVKPKLQERERVEVVIQGVKTKTLLRKKREPEQGEEGEEADREKEGTKEKKRTLIIDKTNQPFDREAFLKKMTTNNLKKVTMKPVLEEREKEKESESIIPVEPKVKKPKKIAKKLLVIEEESEPVEEKSVKEPDMEEVKEPDMEEVKEQDMEEPEQEVKEPEQEQVL